jgi:L-threonylcarbamoyladenylate synthase
VLDLTGGAVLLRPGGVPAEAIEAEIGVIGRPIALAAVEAARTLRSPGLMVSHYAPALPVRLNAISVERDEALLAFGPPLPGAARIWQLSETRDLQEAAARLFAGLRALDVPGLQAIAVMPVPDLGLGAAINDRLSRAAAPRRTVV